MRQIAPWDYKKFNYLIKDQIVFLIGSGNTVRTLHKDVTWLNNKNITVCNSSVKLFPRPDFIVWSDPQWQAANTHVFNNAGQHTSLINFSFNPELCDRENIPYFNSNYALKVESLDGFSTTPHNVCGNNTGTRAINFLAHFKPSTIILVGFDLQGGNWHGKYPATEDKYHDSFLKNFEQMAPHLEKLDIKVYNANTPKHSRLRCFEFTNLEDWTEEGAKKVYDEQKCNPSTTS